ATSPQDMPKAPTPEHRRDEAGRCPRQHEPSSVGTYPHRNYRCHRRRGRTADAHEKQQFFDVNAAALQCLTASPQRALHEERSEEDVEREDNEANIGPRPACWLSHRSTAPQQGSYPNCNEWNRHQTYDPQPDVHLAQRIVRHSVSLNAYDGRPEASNTRRSAAWAPRRRVAGEESSAL